MLARVAPAAENLARRAEYGPENRLSVESPDRNSEPAESQSSPSIVSAVALG